MSKAVNGVVQIGARALLLGAVLASGTSPAAAQNVEREDSAARSAQQEREAAIKRSEQEREAAVKGAEKERQAEVKRTEQERQAAARELEARMRDAQERMSRAASEIAAIAQERAAEAMDGFAYSIQWPPRSTLGLQLSPDQEKEGAKVVDVSPSGPAEVAGVREGDVILRVNGKDVKGQSSREVVRMLRAESQKSPVKLQVLRDQKRVDIDVKPRQFVAQPHIQPPPGADFERFREFDKYDEKYGRFPNFDIRFGLQQEIRGLEVTTLTPELGRYFGTDKGVLVVRAPEDDLLKLQDGDVILSIDGREPTSNSHIARILSSYQPGEKFTLRVMRDRKSQDIVVTWPDRRKAHGDISGDRATVVIPDLAGPLQPLMQLEPLLH